jgi:RNase P subunit RPR2
VVSFTCTKCGFHKFYSSSIQGSVDKFNQPNIDLIDWHAIFCLSCDEKYLYNYNTGFKEFNVEIVK